MASKPSRRGRYIVKEYTVIEFDDDDSATKMFECVPDSWFVDESKRQCMWPPKCGLKSLMCRAVNCERPDDTWGIYECKVVKSGFLSYAMGFKLVREKCTQPYNTSSAEERHEANAYRRKHPALALKEGRGFEQIFSKKKCKNVAADAVNVGRNIHAKGSDGPEKLSTPISVCETPVEVPVEVSPDADDLSRTLGTVARKKAVDVPSQAPTRSRSNRSLSTSPQSHVRRSRSKSSSNRSHLTRRQHNVETRSRSKSRSNRSLSSSRHRRVRRSRSKSSSNRSHSSRRQHNVETRSRSKSRSNRSLSSSRQHHARRSRSKPSSDRSYSRSGRSASSQDLGTDFHRSISSSSERSKVTSRTNYGRRQENVARSGRQVKDSDSKSNSRALKNKNSSSSAVIRKTNQISRKTPINNTVNRSVHVSSRSRSNSTTSERFSTRSQTSRSSHRSQSREIRPHENRYVSSRPDLFGRLREDVKVLIDLAKQFTQRQIEQERRMNRMEVSINKTFIMMGDMMNSTNSQVQPNFVDREMDESEEEIDAFDLPKFPIMDLKELCDLSKELRNRRFKRFLVKHEQEYCTPSKIATGTVTLTKYLKRFICLDLRCSLTLKEKNDLGETLMGNYHRVYLYLIDVMRAGYRQCKRHLRVDEAHTAIRTVWGRSKQSNSLEKQKIQKQVKRLDTKRGKQKPTRRRQ